MDNLVKTKSGILVPGDSNPALNVRPTEENPITAAITFAPPPNLVEAAPSGVFWMDSMGGVILAPAIGVPGKIEVSKTPSDEAIDADTVETPT